ncbi:MAG: protease complex subunit PrcB family protein [Elusimicrobia bacterium]|nr:protease complex subunit PrcB family protein [Elusimicrobiota bacterium]
MSVAVFVLALGFGLIAADVSAQSKASATGKNKEKQAQIMEWKESFGGLPEGGHHVIRDSETWKNYWTRIRQDALPVVDFEKKMVLASFLGTKNTGGWGVEIVRVERKKKKALVRFKEIKPSGDAFVIQAVTSPYHIKVVDRFNEPVEFKALP